MVLSTNKYIGIVDISRHNKFIWQPSLGRNRNGGIYFLFLKTFSNQGGQTHKGSSKEVRFMNHRVSNNIKRL